MMMMMNMSSHSMVHKLVSLDEDFYSHHFVLEFPSLCNSVLYQFFSFVQVSFVVLPLMI